MSMSNFKSTIYVIPSNVRTKNLVVIKTKIQFQRSEYYLNFSPVIIRKEIIFLDLIPHV